MIGAERFGLIEGPKMFIGTRFFPSFTVLGIASKIVGQRAEITNALLLDTWHLLIGESNGKVGAAAKRAR